MITLNEVHPVHTCRECGRKFMCINPTVDLEGLICGADRNREKLRLKDCKCDGCHGRCGGTVYVHDEAPKRTKVQNLIGERSQW